MNLRIAGKQRYNDRKIMGFPSKKPVTIRRMAGALQPGCWSGSNDPESQKSPGMSPIAQKKARYAL
jgi:hypothetical protein